MAEKRMISKKISQSRKVNSLSLKAKLLWTWAIPWFDNHGYLEVEPDFLKFNLFPRSEDISLQDLPDLLQELSGSKLWIFYKHQKTGKLVAYDPKFKEIQILRADRMGDPTYKKEELQELVDILPELTGVDGLIKGKVIKGKVREEKRKDCKETKPAFGEFLNIFLTIEENKKLRDRYGAQTVQDKIESFSNSLKSEPQKYSKYQNHYATLNNWLRKDGVLPPQIKPTKKTFPECPTCKKETTQADIDRFGSCPSCFKPLPQDKIKELIQGIGKPIK